MEKREFVVGRRPQKEWGWMIVLALFFTGSGAGSFLFSLILGSAPRMLIGIILVFVGTLFLLADLSRPLSAWRVILRPRTAWISRGALGIIGFFVFSILHMIALIVLPEGWTSLGLPWTTGPAWAMVLGVIAGAAALFVAAYPGFLLSSSRPIPFWNTPYLPVLFLISGLLCGLGEIYLIPPESAGQTGGLTVLKNLSMGLIIFGFFLFLSMFLLVQPETTQESVSLLSRGSLRKHYLVGVMGIGVIVPLILLALVFEGSVSASLLTFAGICLLLGMLLLRYSILKAGIYTTPV